MFLVFAGCLWNRTDYCQACLQEPTPISHVHVENGEITNPVYSPEFLTHVSGPSGDFRK